MSTNDGGFTPATPTGEGNVFARSGKLQRSPVPNLEKTGSSGSCNTQGEQQGGLGMNQLFTPKSCDSAPQEGLKVERSSMMEIRKRVDELYDFVKPKSNVHTRIKQLVTSIKFALTAAEREHADLRKRAEMAEKTLDAATETMGEIQETPIGPLNPRSEKRKRDTPGEEEEQKKPKNDKVNMAEQGEGSGWRTVENQKEKRKKQKEDKRKEQEKKKPKTRSERSKGDALVVEAKEGVTYAELLRKVRANPELKELGDNVVKTRRTLKGEMLFELKKDPAVKSSVFKGLVEKTLGDGASVRALSQESVVECRDLDEITTVDEVKTALIEQCDLGDVPMAIRLRKAYGGTQTAAIRVPTEVASKLVEKARVKVGWSVCSLRATPRVAKQMERCFKCMGFGHQARNCKGPDRSDLCWKCGGKGHIARDCTRQPRCMLCKKEDGNDHLTGGSKCLVYKTAMAGQQ